MKAFKKHTLLFTSVCLLLQFYSYIYDPRHVLKLRQLVKFETLDTLFWEGNPFVFFVFYMYSNNKNHWLFSHWGGFYIISTKNYPCEIPPWNSMEIYGNPWNSMEIDGNPWNSTELPWSIHGVPWNAMEFHGVSMEFHGVPWSSDGVPWNAMKFHGISWSSMECHGVPWSTNAVPWNAIACPWSPMECHSVPMELDRIPCSLYEKIHRNSVIKQLINLLATCSSLHFLLDRKIGNIWKLSKSKIASVV